MKLERSNPIISGTVVFDGEQMSISGVRIDRRDEDGYFQECIIRFKPQEGDLSDIPFQWPYSKDGEKACVLFSMLDGFEKPMVGGICLILNGKKIENFKVRFPSPFGY